MPRDNDRRRPRYTAVRWLILLMVMCCDPAAIALTIAVAGARR
jgi:hypothetical protein